MLEIFSDLQKKIEAYEPVTPESDASGRSDGSFFGGVFSLSKLLTLSFTA